MAYRSQGYGLIGQLIGANMNVTTDQTIPINAKKYIIKDIIFTNASVDMSLLIAAGGFYTAATKGGTNIVANTQIYTTLSAATKWLSLTLASILGTDIRTEATLYFALTTAAGSAATADIYIFGEILQG